MQIDFINDPYCIIIIVGLSFARILPVICFWPFVGSKMVLLPVKIGLSLIFAMILFPFLHIDKSAQIILQSNMVILLFLKEIMTGMMIGFVGSIPFHAYESAGRFIDIQQNSSIANILVPHFHSDSSLFGNFMFQVGIIVFFAINGHQYFIKALFKSFFAIPLCIVPQIGNSVDSIIRLTADLFIIIVQLSAPAIITIFLIDLMMALINKIVPQFNMFLFSMSIKALSGTIIMLCAFSLVVIKMSHIFLSACTRFMHIIDLLH